MVEMLWDKKQLTEPVTAFAFHESQQRHTKSAKIMYSCSGRKVENLRLYTLFKTEDPEYDTLSGRTSPYSKYKGVSPLLWGFFCIP